jgi:predicted nucleotidyltransferase
VFEIRKFVSLASQCNPNVIEVLFVADSDRLQVSPLGELLLEMRELFLTKRVRHTFAGYAHSQLRRIKGHRAWLLQPPKAPPTRAEFGLPESTLIPPDQLMAAEAAIKKKLDSWSVDFLDELDAGIRVTVQNRMAEHLAEIGVSMHEELWPGAARTLGLSDNFIELLAREKRYGAAKKTWTQYQTWLRERNPTRAAIEAKHGYDCKHGMHLVRLLRMCGEILETGRVNVRRPDAEELLSIRNGAWSYDRLVEWAEAEDARLQGLASKSKLPSAPDIEEIDRRLVQIIQSTTS